MNGNRNSMGDRIKAAAKAAEATFEEKLEKSRASDVDVRSFFTDEELEQLLSGNEFFNGRIADLSKMERYKRACAAAKWLEANSIEVFKVEIEGVSKSRPNAIIVMDIRRLASLRDKELRVFTAMTALADTIVYQRYQRQHHPLHVRSGGHLERMKLLPPLRERVRSRKGGLVFV